MYIDEFFPFKDSFKRSLILIILLSTLLLLAYVPTNNLPLAAARFSSKSIFLPTPVFSTVLSAQEFPKISARAVLVIDPESWAVLYEKNAGEKLSIASLTKLMTALVAYEEFSLGREITIYQVESDGSQMGLQIGETVTVETLLWGLLMNSGNDAAAELARAYPGGTIAFVNKMNQKAAELNLKDTHFDNPVGWYSLAHYSTAYDLALLTRHFLNQPFLAQIVQTTEKTVVSVPKSRSTCGCRGKPSTVSEIKHWYHLKNTHPLLGEMEGVKGVKTGYLPEAGECLITYVERGGQRVIVVLLNSGERSEETREIVDWVTG